MVPIIRCGFGIGNRVCMIANALSHHDQIQFFWRNNPVLPLSHQEVFPKGIDGVEFLDVAKRGFASRWERNIPGESWEAAGDRMAANEAYRRIMEAMAGEPREAPEIAIIGRFWRFPDADCSSIAKLTAEQGKRAFILTDSRRAEIVDLLSGMGVESILPEGKEMKDDLDRTPESLLTYLNDWKTACLAETIITHQEETSVTYPARARGANIIPAFR